jgi:hypothetical protein
MRSPPRSRPGRRPRRLGWLALAAVLGLTGCRTDGRRAAPCGIAAVAGPTTLLSQFSVPNQTLGSPPSRLPERLVVRLVAGPAYLAIVGRTDSLWVVGVEGALPAAARPGFGALVLDQQGKARGVMLYEGPPVEGAPVIGQVSIGSTSVPLVGIQLDPAKFEDPGCPFFPDSVLR